MQAISSLVREHRMIAELTLALQTFAERVREAVPVDAADLGQFASVIRELIDYRHHEKEEGILLPLLARNGFAWSSGVLCEVRKEHRHLSYLIDVLCQAAERSAPWTEQRRREIADAALGFVELERHHMLREDTELLPWVEARLSSALLGQLGRQLQNFDAMDARDERSARVWACAEDLVLRYAASSRVVRRAAMPAGDSAGGAQRVQRVQRVQRGGAA